MISGGGTGGHIFPALAIARGLQSRFPDCEIEFVGAKGRMEMEKVPEAGYRIHGLWISGLQRRITLDNLMFPFKVISSLWRSYFLLRKFKPEIVIGVGGYASGPLLYMAGWMNIPTAIQEQNSYPGITNKLLGSKVKKIMTAFKGPEKYLPASKIIETGNPVREDILNSTVTKKEALDFFGLDANLPVVLVIGGSLGARTLNQSMENGLELFEQADVQLIWQTGKSYTGEAQPKKGVRLTFISQMNMAYAAADVIISRAGALSISELCIVGKPVILVPSPNVSEDHQTKNAMTLVDQGAAILIKDKDAPSILAERAIALLQDKDACASLSESIRKLARPDATARIVDEIVGLL